MPITSYSTMDDDYAKKKSEGKELDPAITAAKRRSVTELYMPKTEDARHEKADKLRSLAEMEKTQDELHTPDPDSLLERSVDTVSGIPEQASKYVKGLKDLVRTSKFK